MTDSNDNTDDVNDETDDSTVGHDYEFDGAGTNLFGSLGSTFGMMGSTFDTAVDDEPSEEIEIAVRLVKSTAALHQFLDYVDEHDIDPTEITMRDMEKLDYEQQLLVMSFSMMANGMVRFGEMFDDGDDDNPFKVSGGDDPVY